MKNRTKIIALASAITVIGLSIPVYKYIHELNRQLKAGVAGFREAYTPGSEAYNYRVERERKIMEVLSCESEGDKYFKEGNYDCASKSYSVGVKKAIEYEVGYLWTLKWRLIETYEKSSQYILAIQEIDWLLAHYDPKEKADLIKELQLRKANLEKLLQAQSQPK